jgi:hypothetical protein
MTLKQNAVLKTGMMLGIFVVAVTIVNLIFTYLPISIILNIMGVGIAAFMIYILYSIILGQLEYEGKLDKISKIGNKTK